MRKKGNQISSFYSKIELSGKSLPLFPNFFPLFPLIFKKNQKYFYVVVSEIHSISVD
jgi:hypothetical protein